MCKDSTIYVYRATGNRDQGSGIRKTNWLRFLDSQVSKSRAGYKVMVQLDLYVQIHSDLSKERDGKAL
jgi:hypothetical protein